MNAVSTIKPSGFALQPQNLQEAMAGEAVEITKDQLLPILSYNKDSGNFTWLANRGRNAKAGAKAGSIDAKGYVCIKINGKSYKAHRLAFLFMTGEWPRNHVDHQDHNRSNNKWGNIIQATRVDNGRNTSLQVDNTSGFTGVVWKKGSNKWQAKITVMGKRIYLGCFLEFNDAVSARKEANKKYGFHANHGSSK